MKKKVNLKFNEMNKKQKIFFVIDWIMKGILIFLILFIASVYLVSCFKTCGDNTSSASTEEQKSDEVHPCNIDNGIMPLDGSTSGADFNFNDVWFNFEYDFNSSYYYKVMDNVPAGVQITVEFVVKTNITGLVDLVPTMILDPWGARTGFTKQTDNLYTCTFTPTVSLYRFLFDYYNKSEDLTKLEGSVYVYYGSYVPGYAQGLAAGIQQGYQDGYNQGAADTSKQYAAGIFSNASAKFGYSNTFQSTKVNYLSSLSIDVGDKISFSGYPELDVNYNYYYIYVRFSDPFIYANNFLLFSFANSFSLVPRPVGGQMVQSIDFDIAMSYTSEPYDLFDVYLAESSVIPFGNVTNTYTLFTSIDTSDSNPDKGNRVGEGHYCNNLLIRVNLANFSNLKSMNVSTTNSDYSGYYNGFNEGYDKGFNEGNSLGYENGFNEGSSVSDDKLNASFNNGYDKGFQEGFNQNESGGFNWLVSSVQAFLAVNFFGDFGIGTLIYVCLGAGLILMFLKMFAGG